LTYLLPKLLTIIIWLKMLCKTHLWGLLQIS
jgi:hypothetical protein